MNTNVEINGIEYSVNVDKAIQDGYLTKCHKIITNIKEGDVFCDPSRFYKDIIIGSRLEFKEGPTIQCWYIMFKDFDGILDVNQKQDLIDHLNNHKMVFAGNILDKFDQIISNLTSPFKKHV